MFAITGGIFGLKTNEIINADCITYMREMENDSVNLTLTDIPYEKVNKVSNGLRDIDKDAANILNFDLSKFLDEVWHVTRGSIIIFCGKEQFSQIFDFFNQKQEKKLGTARQLIWRKTNPSPMNGEYVYLSGVENAVWFKKCGGVFNARCKNTVFSHPCGRSKLHPTEKNHELLKELILDNSNLGDVVFDPCAGSGAHCLVAKENGRQYLGIELNEEYFKIAKERCK